MTRERESSKKIELKRQWWRKSRNKSSRQRIEKMKIYHQPEIIVMTVKPRCGCPGHKVRRENERSKEILQVNDTLQIRPGGREHETRIVKKNWAEATVKEKEKESLRRNERQLIEKYRSMTTRRETIVSIFMNNREHEVRLSIHENRILFTANIIHQFNTDQRYKTHDRTVRPHYDLLFSDEKQFTCWPRRRTRVSYGNTRSP